MEDDTVFPRSTGKTSSIIMRSFITATMITERLCSPHRDGQDILPQLVAKLIQNCVPKNAIRRFRFPYGDQVYLHGPDGILAVDGDILCNNIPDGISLWEIKASDDPRTDANKDFAKAEKKLADAFADLTSPITPDRASFVFVTSKSWESGEWVKEKRECSQWKSIRVLDAVALEEWIEQCPRVMLWFAEQCGLPAKGLYDAEQYLSKLGIGFGVSSLSPNLVLAGRDEAAQLLQEQIIKSDKNFTIHGESAEEAAAFLAAASMKESDAYAEKAPLVFADSQADLNLLATLPADLTLIPLDTETLAHVKTIPEWKLRIIVPEAETIASFGNENQCITLGRCKRAAIEQHLVEQMGRPEHEAKQLARDTKGSLVALLWLIGSGSIGVPRWASRKDATTHASLILAGSWLGDNENDTKIIERLSKKGYRDIETLLQSAELPEGPWIHRDTEWRCVSRDFVWRQLIGRITETMLKDFQESVQEVLCEKNPALELPRSQRNMAGILGKRRKYSRSLRAGLVDSVARLAISKPHGQSWADRIVRELLDPNSPEASTHWLSLVDVYSELAEAAPDVFLECLDKRIQLAEAKQFFQNEDSDYDIFAPTSAHVHLLWALERLAWQKDYLCRVLCILVKLAEIEPDTKSGKNPNNCIVTILLPWSPQHVETMRNAAKMLGAMYAVSPTVTWNVALALLPSPHSVQFPTPTPTYRKYLGARTVTEEEYWEFSRLLVEMMISWADVDANRWASLIEKYPDVWQGWPVLGQSIPDALTQIDVNKLTDDGKATVHAALRKLISRHRQYPDSNWAMPDSVLTALEDQEKRFLPRDAVLRYNQLFSWHPDIPDAPMRQYEDGWDKWVLEKQSQAVKVVYDQGKLKDIRRLADMVELPRSIGQALAQMELSEAEVVELFLLGLATSSNDIAHNQFTQAVQAYIWVKYQKDGEKWLDKVLAFQEMNWTVYAYANLALGLPASPSLWERLQRWGDEVDRLYWSNVGICANFPEHWQQVLEKWRKVKRPWSSLELVARLVDEQHNRGEIPKPSAELVTDILGWVLRTDETSEPLRNHGNMLSYDVEHLFLYLDIHNADPQKTAELEWGWFRVLEHTRRGAKALHSQITSSPVLFVELLKAAFRGKEEPQETTISEEQSKMAERAYRLLKDVHTVPGYLQNDNQEKIVDPSELQKWVEEARKQSRQVGRLNVCDSYIGEILSYAPFSPDGSWPCVEVRNLIENLQCTKLERGLHIGKSNQRGVVCRGKGGGQERKLAKEYFELADKVKAEWPRTAGVLDGLAKSYEAEATRWDEEAKRSEYE